jgi:alpha-galactosidase
MDVDREILEPLTGAARRIADQAGIDVQITGHLDRRDAMQGADFVLSAAAPEMAARLETDQQIIARHLPDHIITEFGGIVGISYSLRQIAFYQALADDMLARCPGAWLLDAANPMPRICQATALRGVPTAGFCSAADEVYTMLWHLFEGENIDYPYTEARQRWQVTTAGLNHFAWVVRLIDRADRTDQIEAVRRRLAQGASTGQPISDAISARAGYLLVPNDQHTQDFLPPMRPELSRQTTWHGSADQRSRRCRLLRAIAEGSEPTSHITQRGSWEKPVDFVAAVIRDQPVHFERLNLLNTGQIPALAENVFVESPVTVDAGGPRPETVDLPESVQEYCRPVAAQNDRIVQAAIEQSRQKVHEAVQMDPTITDKSAGIAAIDECLAAHADILPEYR